MDMMIDYTNYLGERRTRKIRPVSLWYGTTKWHKEPQWLLTAFDLECANRRTKDFAVKDIHASNPRSLQIEISLSIGCGPFVWDKPYLDVLGYKVGADGKYTLDHSTAPDSGL